MLRASVQSPVVEETEQKAEVTALKMSLAKLGFFFWGFLGVYVTMFRVMACVIWGFVRGDGEWS